MAKEKRFCLQCDDGTLLEYGEKTSTGEIFGEPYLAENIAGWHCPICGEIEYAPGTGSAARVSAAMDAAAAKAKAHAAEKLRNTRRKLKLTQAEAGRLFGGGASAFSEYERGKTQPHKSTVLLLRLLNKHPELLNEIRAQS
ncbi:MAG: type II toxin-antitoxin system MqsA family antitoxin [Pseudomonadales bacterium]|jgi:HTH-type transcriptional regulator/antitoxin MqsA|nr:type II toxin-antitoxin system MqsA family antitoxin [Pseudomonadales bacterium]